MIRALSIIICLFSTSLTAQLADELILLNQFVNIAGMHPLGNDQYLIHGESTRSRHSYYAKINGKGHVIWEKEVVGLRGAYPLKNGRLLLFNNEGRVWTTDPNSEDLQNLPPFLPNGLNTSIWESSSTLDYIIITDRQEHHSQQFHSVTFLDREDGKFLYRHESRSILTHSIFLYEQIDESIIEVVGLDYKTLVNTYDMKTNNVRSHRLPFLLTFLDDMTYHDGRLWLSGGLGNHAKVASIQTDMTNPKVYDIDIPPQFGNSRERWLKIEIQNNQMLLCGESNLLGARSIQNTIFFALYDIKAENVIDTLVRSMGHAGYKPFDSFIENSRWCIAGAYHSSDTGFHPPAFISQIKFDQLTSSENATSSTFSFSPNPVSSQIEVKGDVDFFPLQLYNTNGHLILSFFMPGRYSLESLPYGIYILNSTTMPGLSRMITKL